MLHLNVTLHKHQTFLLALFILPFLQDSPSPMYKHPKMSSPDDKSSTGDSITVVIIGAGVIGLCTAYHIAKSLYDSDSLYKVIVVEASSKVFSAASSTNTGILTHTGLGGDLDPLAQYSYNLWESTARQNPQFVKKCGFREGRNLTLKKNTSEGHDLIPEWIQNQPE